MQHVLHSLWSVCSVTLQLIENASGEFFTLVCQERSRWNITGGAPGIWLQSALPLLSAQRFPSLGVAACATDNPEWTILLMRSMRLHEFKRSRIGLGGT